MWVYVDESGNTGNHLFDEEQPLFVTAAMAAKTNFDLVYRSELAVITRKVSVSALHANELGVGRIEVIAEDLTRVIKKADAKFFISCLEKRYLAAAKVYDTYFDQGENLAVPWQTYWLRPLRLMMMFKLSQFVITEEIAQTVWGCLTATNEQTSRALFLQGAAELLARAPNLPDFRAREIVTEALQWALDNPENFSTHIRDKVGRHGHSPNFVAFTNLMDGLQSISKAWKRPVREIVHDEQSQFKKMLYNWHEIYSRPSLANTEPLRWPLENEPYSISKAPGSKFRMTTEELSPGLQVIDVVLWLFKRSLAGKDMGPHSAGLLKNMVFRRWLQNDMSFAGVGAAADSQLGKMMTAPLTEQQEGDGAKMIKDFEDNRIRAMQVYAAKKASGHEGRPKIPSGGEDTKVHKLPVSHK